MQITKVVGCVDTPSLHQQVISVFVLGKKLDRLLCHLHDGRFVGALLGKYVLSSVVGVAHVATFE